MNKTTKSAVDASKELIIDSIVLTTEVFHAIRNHEPIPLEHIVLQPIDSTAEFQSYERPEPDQRILLLTALFALGTILIIAL